MKIIQLRPLEELADSLLDSWKSVCVSTAQFLREVYEFDLRQGYREWGFSDTAEFLDFKCGISRVTAREKVRVARCLVVLKKVDDAFARGELSYAKVRALTKVAKTETEDELLAFAIKHPASHLERRFREIRNGSSKLSSGDANRAHAERHLSTWKREGNRVEFSVELSEEDAGIVVEALEKLKTEITDSGLEHGGKWDDLSLAADALVLMARRSLSGRCRGSGDREESSESAEESEGKLSRDGVESHSHLVLVHVDESALRGKGGASDLPLETMKRLLCDGSAAGVVENGNGEPLSIGRRSRTVPTGMRRALEARDRTCRYPGCSHTKWLDAHHVHHWTEGGDTSLKNLVLLCTQHHRLLHEGGFKILKRSGGGHYFARPDGRPVELESGQSLSEGEETWALKPWADAKELLRDSAESLASEGVR